MPDVRTKQVKSLAQFTATIDRYRRSSVYWYRGCGRTTYELTPRLYRHPTIQRFEDRLALENEVLDRFMLRSIPHQTRVLSNDWECLFLMQHVGVPTRLLDWTESPLIALYFALTTAVRNKTTSGYDHDVAVWMLDPLRWNRHVLGFKTQIGILSPGHEQLKGLTPKGTDPKLYSPGPLAIFGAYNSPRIVAQRGVFTIFGTRTDPMEVIHAEPGFPESLTKIVIPPTAIPPVTESLFAHGITDSVVWPELDGLGKEIRREYGF